MRVGILGTLQIERDGERVDVAGGRLRSLLARLALAAGKPVSVDALADAVWDNDLPGDQQHALQSLISRLRRSLNNGEVIVPAPGGYRLALEPDAVDAYRFETLAAAGSQALRSGDHERASRTLEQALELWRGPALADLPGLAGPAAALEDLKLTALADRAEAEHALGRGGALVAELEAAAAEHPLNERLAARLIQALYAAGRQADALAAYERVRALLADELGAPPSPELQAAHMAVLRGETPAPAKRSASNLRAPVTSFVGREAEIERIGALLSQSRLVTLVGPGGAGKTRLANEALAPLVERTSGGVWMVELAPVTAEIEVIPAVASTLGLREVTLDRPVQTGLQRLIEALAERETILLLDNCEHLIGAVAELADALLGACPDLRIVATSREPLAIAGESLVPVAPLPADPAVQLFADRASAASPGFVIDEHAREICRRLDGLPLAIELAAARLRSMPIDQLAQRLDDRFRLLTGGSRTALPRHRTLRAVVDWSWGLLEEPERRLARRLAVFSAGATEESAAAVCGEPDVLDGLTNLVDRSLVVADGHRYRMLETIREYALEKLDEAGEVEATRLAHANWFKGLVDIAEPKLRGAEQSEWFHRLTAERDDVVAALRWFGDAGDARNALHMTVNLLWFWLLNGAGEEARGWLEFATAVAGDADPVERMIAEGVLVLARAEEMGDADSVKRVADELERVNDNRPLLALARPILAMFAGEVEVANTRLAETLEHPDPWVRATAVLMRAHLAENFGDQEHMRADLERAAEQFRALGDSWGLGMTFASQAGTLMLVDDLDGAETLLEEASEMLDALNGSNREVMLWPRLADIRLRRGEIAEALATMERAVESADNRREESIFFRCLLARLVWLQGDLDRFRELVDDITRRQERVTVQRPEMGHGEAFVLVLQTILAIEDGALPRAAELMDTAMETAKATTDMPIVAMVGVVASLLATRTGDFEDAAGLLGAAAALRGADDLSNPEVARLIAVLRERLGDQPFDAAYSRGRALDREAALSRMPPVRA